MADLRRRLEHGTVQRADAPDVQFRRLRQQCLHLRAELAHNAKVVAPRFAVPAFVVRRVLRTEFAERVRREQRPRRFVVRDRHLRPVHHRRGNEPQRVPPRLQPVPFLHDYPIRRVVRPEKVLHHRKRRGGRDNPRPGIPLHERRDVGGVVRLHVLHDQIVHLPALRRAADVLQPFRAERRVHRVEHGDFLVFQHVRIIRHALRHGELALEKVNLPVVHADGHNISTRGHRFSLMITRI